MSGILISKNTENREIFLLVGKVVSAKDADGSKYEVILSYRDDDRDKSEAETRIVFQDQRPQEGKRTLEWAKWARNMKMRPGSVICATVGFSDETHAVANGYRCYYNGVVTITADNEHENDRYAVGGLVTWMHDMLDSKTRPYISMGVYAGKDRDGEFRNVSVNIYNEKVMEYAKKYLMPREDGTKKYAWFACNSVYEAMNSAGEEYPIYTAYTFMETGTKVPVNR